MQRIDDMRRRMREMAARLGDANRELARLSDQDGLTGLSNRRCFDEALRREARRAAGGPLSLAMIDVDCFKAFNDARGHQAGDECLRTVAALLGAHRGGAGGIAARYGGEEFALILPGYDAALAAALAERVRAAVEALRLPHGNSEVGPWVTVSVGVAAARAGCDDGAALVAAADLALYQAKRAGRNRVVASHPG